MPKKLYCQDSSADRPLKTVKTINAVDHYIFLHDILSMQILEPVKKTPQWMVVMIPLKQNSDRAWEHLQ